MEYQDFVSHVVLDCELKAQAQLDMFLPYFPVSVYNYC